MNYNFSMILKHKTQKGQSRTCLEKYTWIEKDCRVFVYDVPWEHRREVVWSQTLCSRITQDVPEIPGGEAGHSEYVGEYCWKLEKYILHL